MTNYFEACHKCVPPKRHPGCHATCPEYAEGRAKLEADKAVLDSDKDIRHYYLHKGQSANDGLVKYIHRRPKHKHVR